MEPLTLTIVVIALLIFSTGSFIFYQEKQDNRSVIGKSTALKQQEIITAYQEEMGAVLELYEDDKEMCLNEKTKILKRINKELATNIFFDPDEVRAVLNELAHYESRRS